MDFLYEIVQLDFTIGLNIFEEKKKSSMQYLTESDA